jgi:cell division protein FtsB
MRFELHIEDTFHEIDRQVQESSRKMSLGEWNLKKVLFFLAIFIATVLYVHSILFGKNSFSLVEKLEDEKRELNREIGDLRKTNEQLQRNYFNLKSVRKENNEF